MYIDGFVAPVSKDDKDAYLKYLNQTMFLMKEYGVVRMFESWGGRCSSWTAN